MKISEIQLHSISYRVSVPFPVHWSEDDVIATATDKGIQIMKSLPPLRRINNLIRNDNWYKNILLNMNIHALTYIVISILLVIVQPTSCNDITKEVFGSVTDGMPAAFGDFDSDKFTDLFILRNNATTIEILLGDDTEPFLKQKDNLSCSFKDGRKITSVVPGDFNGDALMDVLVTVREKNIDFDRPHLNFVYVFWGDGDKLHCATGRELFKTYGQPLAVDCNQDMIIDLFGLNDDKIRGFWVFNNRTDFKFTKLKLPDVKFNNLRIPHSHAFLDLNHDSYGDLYLTTENGSAEIWFYNNDLKNFEFSHIVEPPPGVDIVNKDKHHYIGQTVFQDMALEGKINQLIPVCYDSDCKNSSIYLRSNKRWHNIKVQFNDWRLINPTSKDGGQMYLNTLTLRAGDFNMDGYPDLLATLVDNGLHRTFLLENVECKNNCDGFPRTFQVRDELNPYNNNTILGVFYDFLQDGVLDVILVHDKPLRVSAYRNNLDYDANFVKVMVLTGITNFKKSDEFHLPLTKKHRIYGTNLPGPTILYHTTTQEGNPRSAISTQLPQSAHFSLHLPYTIFGLGRTPNFVDELIVGVYGHERVWTQLIPNSQMVVIPSPTYDPKQWKAQLFVTPSKLILQSVFALLGTCALISLIIGVLYWKERKEDHKEKLQEAQRFHFDAM